MCLHAYIMTHACTHVIIAYSMCVHIPIHANHITHSYMCVHSYVILTCLHTSLHMSECLHTLQLHVVMNQVHATHLYLALQHISKYQPHNTFVCIYNTTILHVKTFGHTHVIHVYTFPYT